MRVHAFLVIVSFIQPLYLCVPLASYSIDGRYLIAIVVVVETVVAGKKSSNLLVPLGDPFSVVL